MQSQDKTLNAPDTRQIKCPMWEFILVGTETVLSIQHLKLLNFLPRRQMYVVIPSLGQLEVGHQTFCLSDKRFWWWWSQKSRDRISSLQRSYSPGQSGVFPLLSVSILRLRVINLWFSLVFVWARGGWEPAASRLELPGLDLARDSIRVRLRRHTGLKASSSKRKVPLGRFNVFLPI